MIVWYGRLPGAMRLGCPGSSVKQWPRFCSAMPVPAGTTIDPKPWKTLWISEQALRSSSTAHR